MAENTANKKDYKILSNQKCPDCGRPLKQNKVDRTHKYCYVCFKLKNGQRWFMEKGIKKDRLQLQKENRITYNWKK